MREAPIEYTRVAGVEGPLLHVRGVRGVGWDEAAEVRLASGEHRRGVVLDVDDDAAVVQVYEGTSGIRPAETSVAFLGTPARVKVGEAWLGRVWNGRGEPIDGGPPVLAGPEREVTGAPINPVARLTPSDPVLTGVAAIDVMTTLVRGQKLPVFSVGGLPHLELAAQIAAQAHVAREAFCVVFAAMGVTHTDAAMVRDVLEERAATGDLALFVNTADDPIVERLLTPRIALTVAEHLAFECGYHVLVVMADMTSYCEALREVASARGVVPARRGYPGYLYSDLASIYERCGRLRDRPGSITQIPVLTMPAGDITHPVPDLTGYITEGQLVLAADVFARGVYPPIDPLSSLSRMMRRGVGPGRTRGDHRDVAAQLDASVAQARQVRDLAELVGPDALTATDRRYLAFLDAFERHLVTQRRDESVSIDEAFARVWRVLSVLPRRELTMVPAAVLDASYHPAPRDADPDADPELDPDPDEG
ncbi:MAG TPA: V-type ATP synthase subunit B [Acidimicrobiia bacterium]|nr:V-type ATP synthase subunit B [Acidimicrobiia bacterium]